MPCVYFHHNICNFSKHHETKGIFYGHICSLCFAQNGTISAHTAVDCKVEHSKKQLTLDMVTEAKSQPDYVQKGARFCDKMKPLDSRFVHNSSFCRVSVHNEYKAS